MQSLRAAAVRWSFNFNCHSAFDPLLHVCLLGLHSVDPTLDRVTYFHMCHAVACVYAECTFRLGSSGT
jgi:hypothetical protein